MSEPLAYGTGKRKCSIARVYLRNGSGQILVNERPLSDYFPRETYQNGSPSRCSPPIRARLSTWMPGSRAEDCQDRRLRFASVLRAH